MQQHRRRKGKSRGGGNEFGKFARPRKRIDMATATPEPAIYPVSKRGSVWNRDKHRAGGLDRPAKFVERLPQIHKVLEAMICYNNVETLVSQWHSSRIRLKKLPTPVRRLSL